MMLLFMIMSIYVLDYDDDDFVEMQLMMMRSNRSRGVLRSRRRSRRRSRQRRRNIWLVFALSVDKDLIKEAGKTSFI